LGLCQETLTRNWLLCVCFVKKPLQEPFNHPNAKDIFVVVTIEQDAGGDNACLKER
jgi:hypothetical protein